MKKGFYLLLLMAMSIACKIEGATFSEGFNSNFKSTYDVAPAGNATEDNVTINSNSWRMYDAIAGSTAGSDRFNGTYAIRARGNSVIEMNFDKSGGVGTISFYYARYGSDAGNTIVVEYSTNSGGAWSAAGSSFSTSAVTTLTLWTFTLNQTGNVRVRLRATNGGTNRHNIDDFQLTDYSSTPSVNLSINTATGTEAAITSITLTATAASAVSGAQTVDVALTGTASNGDFSSVPAQLTIANGATTGTATFTVSNDVTYECTENGTFTISNPSAGIILGSTTTQALAITDNDFPATNLSINTATGTETATTSITLTASASANVIGAQTFSLALSGTNVTNSDFSVTFPQTITIANGASTGTITFTIADDVTYEGTETATFTMAVTSSCAANGTTLTQNLTITDNDFPTVNLSINTATGTEAATTSITLTATAASAVSGAQTVDVALTGTASNGDFSSVPAQLTIANGATSGTATFTVSNDVTYECTENATFTISNPSAGIILGSTTTQALAITDNDFPATNLSINTATGTETATTSITLTATASANVIGAQTFSIALSGTNVTNSDFSVSFPQTITITNGASTGTVTFTIADDVLYEGPGTEAATFTMTVTSSCAANGTTLTQNLTITDNDPIPVINYQSFDNFDRSNNNTVGTPSSGGSAWTESETSGSNNYRIRIESNMLRMSNANDVSTGSQGREQLIYDVSTKYSTIFSAASKNLEWYFNMKSSRPSPSGYGSNTYGSTVVLGCDLSDYTNASAKGYAVIIGNVGSPDPVKLVSFAGGLTVNSNVTDIAASSQTGETRYYSVRVIFEPCTGIWSLYVRDDGTSSFADPTSGSLGTAVTGTNTTYTSSDLKYFGMLWQHGNSVSEDLFIDNVSIPDASSGVYTWNGTTTDYQVATNWTPTRSCPQASDVLQFNNGIPNTVTNVPTQTIARLTVSTSGTIVNLQASASANILTLQGGTGTDLDVATGTQLNINGSNALSISLATGTTGSISGNMTFTNGAHTLKSLVTTGGITFNSGTTFTAGPGFTGNAFGSSTSNQNSIVFASGSTYLFQDGNNPFSLGQPSSVVVFQTGSLYKHNSTLNLPSFAGRTYGNIELNYSGSLTSLAGSAVACTINGNITFAQGTYNFLHQQPFNITGNLSVASGQTFNYSPSIASTFNFNGSSAQTIGGGGSITFGINATFQISNNTTLSSTVNVNGIASVTAGTLTSSGNLVIENGAQLMHGAGTSLGGGAVSGNIVVKRNGTSSSSVYNYWSTPITSANLGLLGGTNYLYNPANGTATFADDNNPGPDPGWASAGGSFAVGKGYAGQGPNTTVTFTGTANNGTLTSSIVYYPLVNGSSSPGVPYNLIGNPYPSNIDAATFLTANNTKVTGAIYYWDDDNTGGIGYAANDYAIWNGTGSTGGGGRTPNGMIATAQGFFVQALSGATSVSFTNAMRASTATTFFKTEEIVPQRLWLRAGNGLHTNQILVGYVDGATQDMDWFYDAQKLNGNQSISFYSLLNDTTLLGIQGLSPLNGADPAPVPLGLYAGAAGQYSIYIDSIENFPANLPINLLDADLGIIYDLRNGPYVFQTDQGEDNDRFVLFPNEVVTALDEHENLHLNIYPNPNNGIFTVMINSGIEQKVTISFYDVTGKLVFTTDISISAGNNFIPLETNTAGVYMLKVETSDKTYNKRVVLY